MGCEWMSTALPGKMDELTSSGKWCGGRCWGYLESMILIEKSLMCTTFHFQQHSPVIPYHEISSIKPALNSNQHMHLYIITSWNLMKKSPMNIFTISAPIFFIGYNDLLFYFFIYFIYLLYYYTIYYSC